MQQHKSKRSRKSMTDLMQGIKQTFRGGTAKVETRLPHLSYTSLPDTKLSRLSHEELMIPLVYWNGTPKHGITAMYIQRSRRSGDIIVTGSFHGEYILWRPQSVIMQQSRLRNDNDNENEFDNDNDERYNNTSPNSPNNNNNDQNNQNNNSNRNNINSKIRSNENDINNRLKTKYHKSDSYESWAPMAMTFSTNTTPVVSIVASFQHKEQAAFMGIHADGEAVIFSIYGAGALKIGRGDRPMVLEPISKVFGYDYINECYQSAICTNFFNSNLHIIDLYKGKEMTNYIHSSSNTPPIIHGCFMNPMHDSNGNLQQRFVGINSQNRVTIFNVLRDKLYAMLQFDSELSDPAKSIGVTYDGKFVIIISQTEMVIHSLDPLRFVGKELIDTHCEFFPTYWSNIMVLDEPFDVKKLWESQSAVSLSHLIHPDYLKASHQSILSNGGGNNNDDNNNNNNNLNLNLNLTSSEWDPNTFSAMEDPSISSLSRLFATKYEKQHGKHETVQLMTPTRDDENEDDSNSNNSKKPHFNHSPKSAIPHTRHATHRNTDSIQIPPFFVLLWENGAPSLDLYLVSSQTPTTLTLAAKLGVYHNGKSQSLKNPIPFEYWNHTDIWQTVEQDAFYIYVGTQFGTILSYNIQFVKTRAIEYLTLLKEKQYDKAKIDNGVPIISPNIVGKLKDGFVSNPKAFENKSMVNGTTINNNNNNNNSRNGRTKNKLRSPKTKRTPRFDKTLEMSASPDGSSDDDNNHNNDHNDNVSEYSESSQTDSDYFFDFDFISDNDSEDDESQSIKSPSVHHSEMKQENDINNDDNNDTVVSGGNKNKNSLNLDEKERIENTRIHNKRMAEQKQRDRIDPFESEFEQILNEPEHITASCMHITNLGILYCLGYNSGEIYIYNVSDGEPLMEIHTRLSRVTCLLLVCADYTQSNNNANNNNANTATATAGGGLPGMKSKFKSGNINTNNSSSSGSGDSVGDGVLFVGYNDGWVQAFNPRTGDLLLSNRSHLGSVVRLTKFPLDYYVFSVGNDNAFVSYLVYSQLITMKAIQDLIDSENGYDSAIYDSQNGTMSHINKSVGIAGSGNDKVRINWYRGHRSNIVSLYRNEWCLMSDLICCELENGEVYVWCVSTAQLERRFLRQESIYFIHDRCLQLCNRRPDLPHLTKHEFDIFNPESPSDTGIISHHSNTMNGLMKYHNSMNKYYSVNKHYASPHMIGSGGKGDIIVNGNNKHTSNFNLKKLNKYVNSYNLLRSASNFGGNDIQRDNQLNCNCFIIDVRCLGDITFHHQQTADMLPTPNPTQGGIGNARRNVDNSEIRKLSDLLSLLLDWQLPSLSYSPNNINNMGDIDSERKEEQQHQQQQSPLSPELQGTTTLASSFLTHYRSLIRDIAPCYGFAGDFESMTFLFPIASCLGGRWKIQPKWTAAYMLSINTICFWLLQCAPPMELPVASQLVTFYHVSLPELFDGFVEPSRNSMARYCLNSVSEIRQAARMLLTGIIQRMSQEMKTQLIKKWRIRFCGGAPSTGGSNNTNNNNPNMANAANISNINTYNNNTNTSNDNSDASNATSQHTSGAASPRQPPKHLRDMMASGRLPPPNRRAPSSPRDPNGNPTRGATSGNPSMATPPPSLPHLRGNVKGPAIGAAPPMAANDSGAIRMDGNPRALVNRNGKVPLSVLLGAIVICIIHVINTQEAKSAAIRQRLALSEASHNTSNENRSNNQTNSSSDSGFVRIDDAVASSVVNTLINVLNEAIHHNADMIKMALACDYLAEVVQAWFVFVNDIESLLKTLLDLKNCDYPLLSLSASNTLLQAGCAMPQSFVKIMGNEALLINYHSTPQSSTGGMAHHDGVPYIATPGGDGIGASGHRPLPQIYSRHKKRHETALMCIVNLVEKYPQYLYKHLPLTVSTIIRCLDPSAPRRRKALLQATTASLHVLVTKYPNVAFHQTTQHFAIGTGNNRDNSILIYDLRTTTRWRQLKGHSDHITAIEFNFDGNYLVSYSPFENPPTLRCWYIGTGGLLNTLMNLGQGAAYGKCVKICPMAPLSQQFPIIDHLTNTKLTWNPKNPGTVKLVRENKSVLFFTVLPK